MLTVSSGWLRGVTGKWFILSAFRVGALTFGVIEVALSPLEYTTMSRVMPAAGVILYTGFKVAHPLRWYRSTIPAIALTTLDIMVGAALVAIPGEIHIPFSLYTLAPVLTSALLLSRRETLVIAGLTLAYYSIAYFSYPLPVAMENLSSIFATYLVALGFTITLPYAINFIREQQLQSRAISGERRRLGREIHDGLCQTIFGLRSQVEMLRRDAGHTDRLAEKLARLDSLLQEAEKDARSSVEVLRSVRADQPLLSQIEDSLKHLQNDRGILCRLEAKGGEPGLDSLVRLEVLHICEEALRNVAKHSKAQHVTVTVNASNGILQVSITDDGSGLNSARFGAGHGLTVMKERAQSVGGTLQVIGIPGVGTEIKVEASQKCSPELPLVNE